MRSTRKTWALNDRTLLGTVLQGHWGLNSNAATDPSGQMTIPDLSQHLRTGTASRFPTQTNAFQSFMLPYASLSPALDLKWTENKIRIRNTSEIAIQDLGVDTNQVALEFNLVDSLDQDIVKILTTLDGFNNAIGAPINKYRDEYADLEALRAVYFARLTDNIKFTSFFKLFRWFDRKLATSIKQLLPARVDFIGGEFVVQSHMLERNKYKYIYPIFHTPKDLALAK